MEKDLASLPDAPGGGWIASEAAQTDASTYRWVALFIVWAAFLLSYIDRVAWSTVAAPVGASLGIEVALLGAFVTAFYAGYVIANIMGGMLTDLLDGRAMMTLALLPLGVFTFCFGETTSLASGVVIQLAMGLAAGADYSAGMKIIPAWFTRDRGRAMGIYTTATSLAVVLANAIVPAVAAQYDWSTAFRVLGAVTFAWGIITMLFLKNRPGNKRPPARNSAKEMLGLLRNRNLIFLSIAGCGGLWATVGFGAWGNALMTRQYGISPVVAGSIIASFGIGAVIAKPTLGWISDLPGMSRRHLSILCLAAFALALVIFGMCSTSAQFYLVAPVLGAVSYGSCPC